MKLTFIRLIMKGQAWEYERKKREKFSILKSKKLR